MTLFLSGGGSGEDSKKLDRKFLKSLKNKKPVCYLPLAREPPYEFCLEWIKANFKPFKFDNFEMISDLGRLKKIKLTDYSAVYIGGGNTYKLLNDLKNSGFLASLKTYVESGGVVYGGSAGAIIWGKDISTTNDRNEVKITNFEGLNKIGKFSIYCHYFEKDKKKVEQYLKKNQTQVIALPEKTGIIVENNKLKVIGEKPAFIFQENKINKIAPHKEFILT